MNRHHLNQISTNYSKNPETSNFNKISKYLSYAIMPRPIYIAQINWDPTKQYKDSIDIHDYDTNNQQLQHERLITLL